MEAVLSLVKDNGARTVNDLVRDLLPPPGGEAVHHKNVGLSQGDESLIHLEAVEGFKALGPLLLLEDHQAQLMGSPVDPLAGPTPSHQLLA